jgi:hypothetical protein
MEIVGNLLAQLSTPPTPDDWQSIGNSSLRTGSDRVTFFNRISFTRPLIYFFREPKLHANCCEDA